MDQNGRKSSKKGVNAVKGSKMEECGLKWCEI